MHRRLALAMATVALACLSLSPGAGAAGEGSKAAEKELIEAYTPVLIGRTLLYFDLQLQAEEEPAKRWRERYRGARRRPRPETGARAQSWEITPAKPTTNATKAPPLS